MRKSIFILSGFVLLGATLISNNSGVTTVQAKDRTGSPVGLTQRCENCHAGASFSVSIANRMKDSSGTIVTSYIPGAAYTYEVELTSTGATAFGFQTVGLISTTNANAGNLTALTPNCKIVTLTGRKYGEHTTKSNPGLFKMTWVAPAAGSGTVKFYASGIGCNSNSATSGDKAVLGSALTLTEVTSTTIVENKHSDIRIFPNPTTDHLNISFSGNEEMKIIVTDMSGKIMKVSNHLMNNTTPIMYPVKELENGTYLITLIDQNGVQLNSTRFIKK